MPRFKIILTSDYEVWGDGSGCVEQCVVKPASEIMSIAEKYKAPITFFFDVCEYWAFEEIEKKGEFQNDYRPASMMRNQLQEAIRRNHDVQLHFHPQWLSYRFISNQTWKLDNRYWRLPKVKDYHNSDWNIEKLFLRGVETLEDLFKSIKEDYQVSVFRAGAWSIQPENEVIKAMKASGILMDSTVASGLSYNDGQTVYDFLTSPNDKPIWPFSNDVQIPDVNGKLTEVPISTVELSLLRRIYFLSLKILLKIKRVPEYCTPLKVEGSSSGGRKLNSLKRLVGNKYHMLNFSDATSSQEMIYICKSLMKKYNDSEFEEIPIVAISHPKTFGNAEHFERFISWLSQQEKVSFGTFQELLNTRIK